MDIIIRNTSAEPLYNQIYTQIRDQIVSGALKPGDALPSIRALAKDLRISVITTRRAYDELERDGFIVTAAARGCFVAERDVEQFRQARLDELKALLSELVKLAAACGVDEEQLRDMLSKEFKEAVK